MTEERNQYEAGHQPAPDAKEPTPYQFEFRAKFGGWCALCHHPYAAGDRIVKLVEPVVSTMETHFGQYKHYPRNVRKWYAHKTCADGKVRVSDERD
jgi:hypothetical protein